MPLNLALSLVLPWSKAIMFIICRRLKKTLEVDSSPTTFDTRDFHTEEDLDDFIVNCDDLVYAKWVFSLKFHKIAGGFYHERRSAFQAMAYLKTA